MAKGPVTQGNAGADELKLPGVYLPETGVDGLAPGRTAVPSLRESVCDRLVLVLHDHGLHERGCLQPVFPAPGGPVI
jgi:hypothetical protein